VQDEVESEEPTEFGVVWERFIIPETEACDIDRTGDESDGKTERDEVDGNGSHFTIESRKERSLVFGEDETKTSSTTASPSMNEFESFLEKLSSLEIIRRKRRFHLQQDQRTAMHYISKSKKKRERC
jgi:hypothetical protein